MTTRPDFRSVCEYDQLDQLKSISRRLLAGLGATRLHRSSSTSATISSADEQLTTPTAPGQPLAVGNTLWPLGDHLGTLRDLADFSGGSFTITNHDTFGRLLSETNSAVDSHFAFTGKFFDDLGDTDPATSLSHHWNRWYDPQAGKWVSEDPIGFAGGDANLGRYVGNHAKGGRDVNGLDIVWEVKMPLGNAGTLIDGNDSSSGPQLKASSKLQVTSELRGDDIIGIGVLVPAGVEGRERTVAYSSLQKSGLASFLDWVQGGLDAGGVVEPAPFCDITNAGICAARGQWENAGLTILGVFPYLGDAGKAVRFYMRLLKKGAIRE